MKIALINTSDIQGGAAIACYRLAKALDEREGVKVNMLVKEQLAKDSFIINANDGKFKALKGQVQFALEKLSFIPYESSKSIRFFFSNPNVGQDISELPVIQEADILHFHWINKGFLSFRSIEKLLALGKPIVWTLHDMWAFTGGCHYSKSCTNFTFKCGNCHFLKHPSDTDLSNTIWKKKKAIYKKGKLQMVTCSKWLKSVAETSSLLESVEVNSIPNPIDTTIFKPAKSNKENGKYVILFQAMNINDKRKGLHYFLEALTILKKENPTFAEKIQLLIFGKDKSDALAGIDYDVRYLGMLSNQASIVKAYNQCDIFVIPSLEDNLPNTVMESLACGKPVVAFNTGGIPEMVTHQENGFIAPQMNAAELAKGIVWTLENNERYQQLSENARAKVIGHYTNAVVARRYITLYQSILEQT